MQEDSSFNSSLFRYLPLISYFNTLAISISMDLNVIISTNQTDAVNKLLASFETGTLPLDGYTSTTSNIITGATHFESYNIFLTKYDKLNINYIDGLTYENINVITSNNFNPKTSDTQVYITEIINILDGNLFKNFNNNDFDKNIDILTRYNSLEGSIY